MRCIPAVLLTMMLLSSAVVLIDYSSADSGDNFVVDGRTYDILDADNVSLTYINDDYATPTITVGPTVTHPDTGITYNIKKIEGMIDSKIVKAIVLDSVVLEDVEGDALCGENIESITVNDSNPYLMDDGDVLYNKLQTKLIKYPQAKSGDSFDIPDTVTELSSSAFWRSSLRTVTTTGDKLTTIGPSAFRDCTSLENIGSGGNLPNGLVMIGSCAFNNCPKLSSVGLPSSLLYIGSFAFENTGLTSIKIPYLVDFIGDCAFSNCTNLKEIDCLCEHYNSIDGILYHVSDDEKMKTLFVYPAGRTNDSFTIPDDVVSISPYAFAGTEKLKTIILPKNMVSIPSMAFTDCKSLENIDIKRINMIGYKAFAGCTGLKSVTFSDSIIHIGYEAFKDTSIETVTIPSSLTSLEDNVFYGCSKLTKVTIEESAKFTIEAESFSGCLSLNEMTIKSKDIVLEEDSLSIGYSEHIVTLKLNVPAGYVVPDNAADKERTTLNISYIGERPYPWVNIIGAIVCGLGIIGILYGMRQV